jgi:hypothetical protein
VGGGGCYGAFINQVADNLVEHPDTGAMFGGGYGKQLGLVMHEVHEMTGLRGRTVKVCGCYSVVLFIYLCSSISTD